jgi:excisionase family DNA binding protein
MEEMMRFIDSKESFSIKEVMGILGVKSRTTVYGWIESGKLKAYQTPGGDHRVRQEELKRVVRAP